MADLEVAVTASVSDAATTLGVPVGVTGAVPDRLALDRSRLEAVGFDGKVGSVAVLPVADGPTLVAVGIGDPAELNPSGVRDAAAAFARAAEKQGAVTMLLPEVAAGAAAAAQAAVEGIVLARYRYDVLRGAENDRIPLASVTLVPSASTDTADAEAGAARGRTLASATSLARDLANTPHSHLNASGLAELAEALAGDAGLSVEVFGKDELVELGCGGLLGVNAGSVEPPRMIKLRYRPDDAPAGHVAFVGKGIMYDSGGLSLKPGNEVHAQMKNDMSGAAAVLAAMTVLREVGCPTEVTAWLMCTDNMPSGTAMALGDVITIRGGTTIEVVNTDAEGRLVLSDALVLATEEGVDAIIDVATLTGACQAALGTSVAGVMGNDDELVDQIRTASAATDESVWPLPLERRYRKQLDSTVADMKNTGGPFAGAITAALFLAEFVGDLPWAHLDIAGTAQTPDDTLWHTAGCSGFGARLLVEIAERFSKPAA
jgi:leucyl aminopeptidase